MHGLTDIIEMNADKMRLRADNAKARTIDVSAHVRSALTAIQRAADAGKYQIGDPFIGTRTAISAEQKRLVWEALRERGFVTSKRPFLIKW